MKLIQLGGKKAAGGWPLGRAAAHAGPEPAAAKTPDALGHRFEQMAGALDQLSAAAGAVRAVEGVLSATRVAIAEEFDERRRDQSELSALRPQLKQAQEQLIAVRESEAAAKARLLAATGDLDALRLAHTGLEARIREADSEGEQLKADLANERRTATAAVQSAARLTEQSVHLDLDLAAARAQIQALEVRTREAEAAAATAERARGLLDADLVALRRRQEQSGDELLQSGRRQVETESALASERARASDLESALAASREEALKLSRELEQRSDTFASQGLLSTGRLETLQARADRQEEQISELARMVEDLTARERAAMRELSEAKLLRERAEERVRQTDLKLAEVEKEAAAAGAARQAAVARAETLARAQRTKGAELDRLSARETALRDLIQQGEQRQTADAAAAEARINELCAELERERSEHAVAAGSLEALRKDRAAALNRLARYEVGLGEAPASESLETASAG